MRTERFGHTYMAHASHRWHTPLNERERHVHCDGCHPSLIEHVNIPLVRTVTIDLMIYYCTTVAQPSKLRSAFHGLPETSLAERVFF